MAKSKESASARVRGKIGHPVIDADGHILEVSPVLLEYISQIGGSGMVQRYMESPPMRRFARQMALRTPLAERRDHWSGLSTWWMFPTKNGLDRATAMFPRLLNERMDELGFDYAILYPTEGVTLTTIADTELRQVATRALNTYLMDLLRPYARRMTPVALIQTHSPQEAVAGLEHAASLGFKAAVLSGYVIRPVPRVAREMPKASSYASRLDLLALDSELDYDPLWQACRRLKIAPAFHNTSMGFGTRRSPANFVFNHIGGAAQALEAIAKSLVLGGVTRRFPDLTFSFLEGGVAWGCSTYADLIGHWEKRNVAALSWVDPENLDAGLIERLAAEYGDARVQASMGALSSQLRELQPRPAEGEQDDFARCGVSRPEDFIERYARPFFFGCEADDPMTAWAFDRRVNPFGQQLQAMLGSDIGHWDVQEMREVLAESHEMVEQGLLSPEDFRQFTFSNAARAYATVNPAFFEGTSVAEAVRGLG